MQKTTYFGDSEINELERMLPEITIHLKALSADINPLVAELRAAIPLSEGRAQNALVMDLNNLIEGLRGVLTLKTSGVSNEDTRLAETDIRRLILDMRQQSSRHIGERSRQVRVHAEASVLRKDPDIKPRDVSDSFRVLYAQPSPPPSAHEEEAVMSLGLPEAGGPIGHIVGDVLMFRRYETPLFENAAPGGTSYLPPGHMITLRRGEQILLRTAGFTLNDENLSIKKFDINTPSFWVQAADDDVKIYGPATFHVMTSPGIMDLLKDFEVWEKKIKRKNISRFAAQVSLSLVGLAVFVMLTMMAIIAVNFDESNISSIVLLVTGVFSFFFCAMDSHGESAQRLFKPVCKNVKSVVERFNFLSGAVARVTTLARQITLVEAAKKHVLRSKSIHFYPVRKMVVNENSGDHIIRPQPLLMSTTSEVSAFYSHEKVL